jgi:hypothetical protein
MFGSFEAACAAFDIEIGGKKHRFSSEELLLHFENVWLCGNSRQA